MSCYEDKTESLHTLALNLAHLMNPNVKEMTAGGEKKQAAKQETGSLEEQKQSSESDTIEQLQKYKGLLDAGVITEEEFAAKKKQLLNLMIRLIRKGSAFIYEICKNNSQMLR